MYELETIVFDSSAATRKTIFEYNTGSYEATWSSTDIDVPRHKLSHAHGIDFHFAKSNGVYAKDANLTVRCVRGVSLDIADLNRTGNIVTDHTTNLQWQDNEVTADKTWLEAINYCETLELNELADWRLPNQKELVSISAYGYDYGINPIFQKKYSANYWSSTTDIADYGDYHPEPKGAKIVVFNNSNGGSNKNKSDVARVRCVRTNTNTSSNITISPAVINFLLD